jgi:hypothetical protein
MSITIDFCTTNYVIVLLVYEYLHCNANINLISYLNLYLFVLIVKYDNRLIDLG